MPQGLVFDIGMNNGEDSAYYLPRGYSVVGVDANPALTAECALRFQQEIGAGRMKIVNAGVLDKTGEFTFYRNLQDHGWSSFEPEMSNKGSWEAIKVPCTAAQKLIAEYGKPYFMKIDIQGTDFQAIQSITQETAPPYIRVELSAVDPIVEALLDLGYSSFKFVDGDTHYAASPIFPHQIGWRFLRKAGRVVPAIRSAISKLPPHLRARSEFDPPGRFSPDGYVFLNHSSGPFGEQAAGEWLNPKQALRWFERQKRDYRKANEPLW
jgi:FkbM family methyltransferase